MNSLKEHCKKLEVDLTPKMLSQLQCGSIQVQVVVHLLLQGFRVTPLPVKLSSKRIANDIHFVIACLHACVKRGWNCRYIHVSWTLKNIHALLANL